MNCIDGLAFTETAVLRRWDSETGKFDVLPVSTEMIKVHWPPLRDSKAIRFALTKGKRSQVQLLNLITWPLSSYSFHKTEFSNKL